MQFYDLIQQEILSLDPWVLELQSLNNILILLQAIPGVPKIKEGYNPATWMLDVSSAAVEAQNNIDFAEVYANSELYR